MFTLRPALSTKFRCCSRCDTKIGWRPHICQSFARMHKITLSDNHEWNCSSLGLGTEGGDRPGGGDGAGTGQGLEAKLK